MTEPRTLTNGELSKLHAEWKHRVPAHSGRRLLATVDEYKARNRDLERALAAIAECPGCHDCRRLARSFLSDKP